MTPFSAANGVGVSHFGGSGFNRIGETVNAVPNFEERWSGGGWAGERLSSELIVCRWSLRPLSRHQADHAVAVRSAAKCLASPHSKSRGGLGAAIASEVWAVEYTILAPMSAGRSCADG
jgi:hypothetical protein